MKNNYYISFLKNFIKTQSFKFIMVTLIINSFYGAYVMYVSGFEFSYAEAFIRCFASPYFLIILYFLFLFNVCTFYHQIVNNYEYSIRVGDKDKLFKKLIHYARVNILFILLLQVIFFTIIFSLTNGISNFVVSELFYIIYYLFKVYIIAILINEINIYLLSHINKYIVMLINSILYICLATSTSWLIFKTSTYYLYGYFGDYLRQQSFSNIISSISSFALYCCFLLVFIGILDIIKDYNFRKIINKLKYIIINDVNYILKKSYKYIIGYIILIGASCFIFKITGAIIDEQNVKHMLGLDFSFKIGPLAIVIFGLHFSMALYLLFGLVTNDLNNGINNIFLRMKAKDWIHYKIISIALIYFLLKIVIYCCLSFILSFENLSINIFAYFSLDYLFFILVQLILLLIYILKPSFQVCFLTILFVLIIKFKLFNMIQFSGSKIIILIFIILIWFIIKTVFSKLYINVFEKNRR